MFLILQARSSQFSNSANSARLKACIRFSSSRFPIEHNSSHEAIFQADLVNENRTSSVHVFGIRHHGPGSARSLLTALEDLQPVRIFLEGPADAQAALPFACSPEMLPPVSLLIYPQDDPRRAVSYPLAEFSPEWQTLRWAAEHNVPVHLIDLPQTHRLALEAQAAIDTAATPETGSPESPTLEDSPAEGGAEADETVDPQLVADVDLPTAERLRADPIAMLADAAGYPDHELWWEEQVERRADATGLFAAILEAMQAVREAVPETRPMDLLREAFMRKTIRAGLNDDKPLLGEPVAIICGAWHAPVLTADALAGKVPGCELKTDRERLKGLPKCKTTATWIPWTYSRLAYRSGYGAGVTSPGWYDEVWRNREAAPLAWLTRAARLLRQQDLDASSANVIEAHRLAETLAAIRELRSPGLEELNAAMLSVYCHGNPAPLSLIRQKLEIGDRLGSVPEAAPAVPLAANLASLQKSLRLKPSSAQKLLDLDLRKEMHLQRSHLLHQLHLLGINWGEWQGAGGGDSTFHEVWQLQWQPEFAVAIIEANIWGNTVAAAAAAKLTHQARETHDLKELSQLLDQAILANLTDAIPELLKRIQSLSAIATDVLHLLLAVLPLARIVRYGSVRQERVEDVWPILQGMCERIFVGLVAACSALDDAASEEMLTGLEATHEALTLIHDPELLNAWYASLNALESAAVNGLLRGWSSRVLLEGGRLTPNELATRTSRALSHAVEHRSAAAWLTGLLRGSGLLLIHQNTVWSILDNWVNELTAEDFRDMLPLLRRAFSSFSAPERRMMGNKIKDLPHTHSHAAENADRQQSAMLSSHLSTGADVPHKSAQRRGALVLPVLSEILNRSH